MFGCAGADWHALRVAGNYAPPGALNVQFLMPNWQDVDREAFDAFTSAALEELADHGIQARAWQHGSPPPPAVLVAVERYDPGSGGLRWLCGTWGCGEGVMFAVVDVYTQPFQSPVLTGRVEGWVRSGFFGGSSITAAREAGQAVGCAIVRGTATRCGGFSRSAE
jgi:hypothetical protein